MALREHLAKLEDERWHRRMQDLQMKFQVAIDHFEQVAKLTEETYRAKRAVMEAAVKRSEPMRTSEPPRLAFPKKAAAQMPRKSAKKRSK